MDHLTSSSQPSGIQIKGWSEVKGFDALEWLAAMCSHVPNKRGSRWSAIMGAIVMRRVENQKKADTDINIPCILEPELSDKTFRKRGRN